MVLALDIGNSAVKGGLFDDDGLVRTFFLDGLSVASADVDAWREGLDGPLDGAEVTAAGLVSVVPAALPPARSALQELTGGPVRVVTTDAPLPFTLGYDTPDTLGTDRLAAAAAGWARYGQAGRDATTAQSVLVVDVGTAVTYEVVDRDGVYRGGAIGPGPRLMRRALQSGTAQLPSVPLSFPPSATGRSTSAALQSGIMWGVVDSIRGMTDRLAGALPDRPVVVLTGGWSDRLRPHLNLVDHVAPHLVLEGVRMLAADA
jgi:type III pantothenate kinase